MAFSGFGQLKWVYSVVLHPSNIVQTPSTYQTRSYTLRLVLAVYLLLFFLVNILLYSLPLSLAGVGSVEPGEAPTWFRGITENLVQNPTEWWEIGVLLVNNGQWLLIFGLLSYVTYHTGVFLTRKSNGALFSLHDITYSTSIYLAIVFNVGVIGIAHQNLSATSRMFRWMITEYLRFFGDILGAEVVLPEYQPVFLSELSLLGQMLIVGLLVSLLYYAYALYLGARLSHNQTRFEAIVVIGFVALSPVIFGIGTILVSQFLALPEVFSL